MEINKWYIFVLIAGAVLVFALNNWAGQGAYNFISCTFNNMTCGDCVGWDGVCTQEIKDECCEPIRMCGGSETNPYMCDTKYCSQFGEKCVGEYGIEGVYNCICVDATAPV